MALIFCPECGTQVSDKAEKCIKCGFPLQQRVNNSKMPSIELENTARSSTPNENFNSEQHNYNKVNPSTKLNGTEQKTDPFAIIAFAAGLGGFIILPILFVPIGYIAAIVSYYRLKENKELKGSALRIIGAILTSINIIWLMYQYEVGPFKNKESNEKINKFYRPPELGQVIKL